MALMVAAVFLLQHKNNISHIVLIHLLGLAILHYTVTKPASALVDYCKNNHITIWFSDINRILIIKDKIHNILPISIIL